MDRKSAEPDVTKMAGWLFADLLLAIALIFLATATGGNASTETPTTPFSSTTVTLIPSTTPTLIPTATPTTTPTPTVSPSPSPPPLPTATPPRTGGLDPEPAIVTLSTNMNLLLGVDNPQKRDEVARVRQLIRSRVAIFDDLRAGMVLCSGTTLASQPSRGRLLAETVNALLVEELPEVFGDAAFKAYHYLTGDSSRIGGIEMEIYWILE